jgi:uncharacterized protein YbjQ (UPF0145 family)
MTEKYNLVFNGEILEEHQIEDVKQKLAPLLKTDEKGIERLFSGKSTVIKKDVDYETAMKFRKAFKKIGAKLNFDMGKPTVKPDAETLKTEPQPEKPVAETVKIEPQPVKPEAETVKIEPQPDESNMMTCPNCGYQQDDSSECIKCGTSSSAKEETTILSGPQPRMMPGKMEVVNTTGGAVILTNIESIPGRRMVEHFGLVSGSTIRAKHIGRDIMAGLKNIVGGELKGYTQLLNESRNQAIDRMIEQARQLGGNAIVNIRFSTSSVAQGAAELYAYGTAVRVE